jgi:exodeoxyribonuclease-3
MKLVTWNCKQAIQRKLSAVGALRPDILVVPECPKVDGLQGDLADPAPADHLWVGDNPSKGLGIFAYGDYQLAPATFHDPKHRHVFPIAVSGPLEFLLVAVWTLPDDGSYVRPVSDALDAWGDRLQGQPVIITGDFNANYSFDKPSRQFKFQDVVERLATMGVKSLYHELNDEAHGQESSPTFFMYHQKERPFHIDYVFASTEIIAGGVAIELGAYEDWHELSDHMPVTVSLDSEDS